MASDVGVLRVAVVAAALSPEKPRVPVPAMVVIWPPVMERMRWLPVSAI